MTKIPGHSIPWFTPPTCIAIKGWADHLQAATVTACMGVFVMDKKILFYVFLVLLLDNSYCTPADGKFI